MKTKAYRNSMNSLSNNASEEFLRIRHFIDLAIT